VKLAFDHRMMRHILESAEKEHGVRPRSIQVMERLLQREWIIYPLALVERLITFVLSARIPIYSAIVYSVVTNLRGLPHFAGMYVRALYYRGILKKMDSNVFIDQGVFFAFPGAVELNEFSYIDKNVIVMSRAAKVGRRVHIAPRVFVSGGGDFEIEDYACIATNSNIITSTEVLKDGARCSGPMVKAEQRVVYRGKVLIRKDAFIGANVTILPGVTIGEGSVAGAGATIAKDTAPWGIYVGARSEKVSDREAVRWPED